MLNFIETIGKYGVAVYMAIKLGWAQLGAIVAIWYCLPVAFATLFHPTDAIELVYTIEGKPLPQYAYWHQIFAGEVSAVLALAALCVALLFSLTWFYRRIGFSFPLYPLCLILVGFVGNGAWWFGTGDIDFAGAACGFLSAGALVFVQKMSEQFGQDLSFGRHNRPEFERA